MVGKTLAHYRILGPLGVGGMGEVYRARDTKLERDVAIKVLPEDFAADPDRLARFEREAKHLASLNHANIATIYGLEDAAGIRFIAMECVEGETLAERIIAAGRLDEEEALDIARQIAEALESAHAAGVIHRDLKPANVKTTPDGKVKVLDFGLAKAWEDRGDGSGTGTPDGGDVSQSPTVMGVTRAGVILGTASYMSPEQARGMEVDKRTDIWAFGCVLWECLTGQRLFEGTTASDSIGAILHTEPDWSDLPPNTSSAVQRLLSRCLAKDPRKRLHDIADARIELEERELNELEDSERFPLAATASTRSYKIAVTVLAVAFVASLSAALLSFMRPAADRSNVGGDNPLATARFTKVTDFEGAEFDAAISPDGRFVAFVSDRNGPFEVFVGQIGGVDFHNLASGGEELALEDPRAPVRSVGFNGDGSEILLGGGPRRRVRSMPLLGGPMRNFLGEHVVNVAWSPDGEQLVYHERLPGDPLYTSDRNGADVRLILGSPEGTHQHYPTWSVDGRWIYLVRGRPTTLEMDLWRVGADGEGLEQLTQRKLDVRYPTPLDETTVLYSARDADGAGPWLWAVDVETKVSRRASVGLEQYSSLAASADGRRLVATVHTPRSALWSVPILDRQATESDAEPFADLPSARAMAPRFGGSSLFYLSSRGSGDGLWRLRDGEIAEIWRGSDTALLEPAAVSPDGESVVLLLRREDGWRLHLRSADGAKLEMLSDRVDARGAAAWSPDGSLIVYVGAQVNVVAPLLAVRPNGDPVELPEIEVFRAGERMRFTPDGSGLVYMQGYGPSQDFWLLDLSTMQSRRLTQLDSTATMRTFDITPDGQGIVFDRLSEDSDIVLIELDPQR